MPCGYTLKTIQKNRQAKHNLAVFCIVFCNFMDNQPQNTPAQLIHNKKTKPRMEKTITHRHGAMTNSMAEFKAHKPSMTLGDNHLNQIIIKKTQTHHHSHNSSS